MQKGLPRFSVAVLSIFGRRDRAHCAPCPLYFFAGGGVAVAGAAAGAGDVGVTADFAAAPALDSASVVAFLASAAFFAIPATRRQYALSTLPDFSTFVGTIQAQAVASVLHDASSRPLHTTKIGALAGAAALGGTGAAGALAAGAGAAGAGVVVWAEAATLRMASEPATADTPIPQTVIFFITAVVSSG